MNLTVTMKVCFLKHLELCSTFYHMRVIYGSWQPAIKAVVFAVLTDEL